MRIRQKYTRTVGIKYRTDEKRKSENKRNKSSISRGI